MGSLLPVCLSGTHSVILRIVVGLRHSGAFTFRVSFEVGWLSCLCVMWLATGAKTVVTFDGIACYGGHSCMRSLLLP